MRLFVDFDVFRVETVELGPPVRAPVGEPYTTRQVSAEEYRAGTAWLEGDEHERGWAFERGDRCFANLLGDKIVGYTFYGVESTLVKPGLVFRVPAGVLYLYAAYTHPDHRGRRLANARSDVRRMVDHAVGFTNRVVWYVSVANSASRASARLSHPILVGYVGYVRSGGRFRCFASPGSRREGFELLATRTPQEATSAATQE